MRRAFFIFKWGDIMCSIAGVIDFQNDLREQKDQFLQMQLSLARRGPDQSGSYSDKHAVLLHNRLCVIDLENGLQPMTAVRGRQEFSLVYNGEIYNTDEVRNDLIGAGYDFQGHSDTEVVLKSYMEWGERCVERLNGIFAFAVYEAHERRLFLARDRIGVKPFFYTIQNGAFFFASEIKGLLAHPDIRAQADRDAVREILLTGPGRTPGYGVFKGICELPAGYRGYFDENGLRTERYWQLQAREHTDSLEETIEKVRYLVTDSIERQLISDVPVGTFLSGGLDSGIISSIANQYQRQRGKVLDTFSVDYRDNDKYFTGSKFQPNSDSEYIGKLSDYLGCRHTLVTLDTEELADALYDAVDARDLPGMADVDSSLLLFCKEVKKQVTVALSGECADEIFGGYPWYRDPEIRMAEGFPWSQSIRYRANFLREEYADGLDPQDYVMEKYRRTVADVDLLPDEGTVDRRMREMMRLNTDWFMQTLLDRKDRMSMYSALEVRVPFCDYRIAEYLYSVPWEMKDYKHYEKGLLREAMKDCLPPEILWRKKSPYPKTHHPAYLRLVSQRLREVMENESSPLLRVVKKEALEELLNGNRAEPWYGQLMTTPQTIAYMLQINYWLETYKVELI